MTLENIVTLAKNSPNDFDTKNKFKKESLNLLKKIAKELNLTKGSFHIGFNAGGNAVSGDAILHHEKFYLTIGYMGVMYRSVKGLTDYVGCSNHWAIGFGKSTNTDGLIRSLENFL